MAKIAGRKKVIPPASSLGLLYVLRDQPRVREALEDPAAEDEDRSPDTRSGTRARAQAPARLNNEEKSVTFLDVPRCCVTGKEQVVNRFQRIEGRWGYSGTPDRIKLTVDRRIFVVGFGMYGSIHGPTEYQVSIQMIHCGTGKTLGSNDTTFQCDGSSSTFRVLFKEPVELAPLVTYIASACLKGPDSHYGTKGLRRIVHQSPSSGCVTFQFTYAAGNNNGTSVEDGQIPEIIFYTKLS